MRFATMLAVVAALFLQACQDPDRAQNASPPEANHNGQPDPLLPQAHTMAPPGSVVLVGGEVEEGEAESLEEVDPRALAAISALLENGDPAGALTLISVLESETQESLAWERALAPLRLRCRAQLRQTAFGAAVVLDEERIALGTPITGTIAVRNLSALPLFIAGESTSSARTNSMIRLNVSYQEYGLSGVMVTESSQINLLMGESMVIEPGVHKEFPIVIDSGMFGESSVNYRVFSIAATLFPAELRVGEEKVPGTVTFAPDECAVFPRNYEHLAAEPFRSLKEAIAKNSPPHVCLSAALVPQAQKSAAIHELTTTLRPLSGCGEATRVAACVGLRILTGEERPADPREWLAWAEAQGIPNK